ncbi:hypothetical protein KQ910_07880 [Reyranella sp. MMS21-HV4-11]|uniref:Helix-turn-helix domain-containing protein n=1 Tax=Reyranella humidisoli TaxID=2849149 RepID=A0ABS6IIH2_9HYPH|nr:hypothetical protein [Reyranella sp. MMS21-HV4-11]MBU8873679.1 hypothetical protein [Reyranella sp. MMS21-HV4-11]
MARRSPNSHQLKLRAFPFLARLRREDPFRSADDAEWKTEADPITVAQAAVILGCDQATVRALVRCEAIEGHRVCKTDDQPSGVRINLESVVQYKRRHAIVDDRPEATPAKPPRRRPSNAAAREAIAELRALGSRI